jgi:pimeloyl-ACP methyl ester carboxylesterase
LKTWLVLFVFGIVAFAAAAPPESAPRVGLPGTTAQRIKEPVFKGEAMVYEAGKQHAQTVLLVHGLGDAGASDYADHVAWLARSHHVLAVDLPGFAQSDKNSTTYSPTTYVAFLKHVVDRFARKPLALVGHSMGGVVVLRYAATHPGDLKRLVVVDAPGILHRAAYTGEFLSYIGLGLLQAKMADSPAAGVLGRDSLGPVTDKLNQILGRAEQSNIDPQMILSIPALRQKLLQDNPLRIAGLAVAMEDLSKEIPKIETETLVIWGKQDTIAPLRTGRLLAHVMPRAQLAVIERAGHEPMRQTPDRFRDLLEPFLERGLAPAPAKTRELTRRGSASCDRQNGQVYEGDYDTLTLTGCKKALLSAARVRELRVLDSTLAIEDSDIGGDSGGLTASNAVIEMTNGRIRGPVAMTLGASRLDLAGVEVEGTRAAMEGIDVVVPAVEGKKAAGKKKAARPPVGSSVVFSLSRVRSPLTDSDMHGYVAVVSGKPL